MINIIGAGGVGSWLAPAMCKLVGASRVKRAPSVASV